MDIEETLGEVETGGRNSATAVKTVTTACVLIMHGATMEAARLILLNAAPVSGVILSLNLKIPLEIHESKVLFLDTLRDGRESMLQT